MKVAIVAQGDSWRACRGQTFDQTWAINAIGLRIPHDLLFHMDDCRVQEARATDNPSVATLLELLKGHWGFITSTAYPEYPGAIEFPLETVCRDLGVTYLNNTTAYAVAWAIHSKVEELHLYGVDFSYPGQPHKAEKGRGCTEFLLGIAHERGMRIVVPETTTLLDANVPAHEKPYGYDAWDVVFEDGKVIKTPRPIPTAREMEERYGLA